MRIGNEHAIGAIGRIGSICNKAKQHIEFENPDMRTRVMNDVNPALGGTIMGYRLRWLVLGFFE